MPPLSLATPGLELGVMTVLPVSSGGTGECVDRVAWGSWDTEGWGKL